MTLEVTFLVWGLVAGYLVGALTGYFVASSRQLEASRDRELALMAKLVPSDPPKKLQPYQESITDGTVGTAKTIRPKEKLPEQS